MATILPVDKKIAKKIAKFGLEKKWKKQLSLLESNPSHPSLKLELLEPKNMGVYSFRIDRKFRVLMFFHNKQTIEILSITVHYH